MSTDYEVILEGIFLLKIVYFAYLSSEIQINNVQFSYDVPGLSFQVTFLGLHTFPRIKIYASHFFRACTY